MGVIATLLPDERCQERLRQAVRDRHAVVGYASWDALTSACADPAVHLAVVDLFAEGGTARFDRVRQLRLRCRRVSLVAYVAPLPHRARDLFDAGRAGFDGLLLLDVDDTPAQVRALIEQAEARGVAALLRDHLDGVHALTRNAVLLAVTRAHLHLNARRLADILAAPRRSLVARLAADGFPPPQKLITWGRLIVAAQMLEDEQRSADSIAGALDFPSGSAFRNSCQRYLHATPGEIREHGGASFAVGRFLAAVGRG